MSGILGAFGLFVRDPTWTEGDKAMIGTAVGEVSRVWFTVARGRLTEIFYPSPDRACVRALECRVRVGERVVDEMGLAHRYEREPSVPIVRIVNEGPGVTIFKEVVADPRSDVVLQRLRVDGGGEVRVVLEPALDNELDGMEGEVIEDRGTRVLTAERAGRAVALACSQPWRSCELAPRDEGNVLLVGELEPAVDCVLALAFAHSRMEALHAARCALARGYDAIRDEYVREWRAWNEKIVRMPDRRWWTESVGVLKTLETKRASGGRVAALATPWGRARSATSGTYHAVWTRDLVHCMTGLLAAGVEDEARQALVFLRTTQHPDGHWPQNMLLDGERLWGTNEELDEAAQPILLVELLRREGLLDPAVLEAAWEMVKCAADHLVRVGPSTRLDRWEDTSGVTPYTLGSEIAALRCAARLAAEQADGARIRRYAETADRWSERIDELLYRRGGPLADKLGIAGYYVRACMPGEPLPALDLAQLPKTEMSVDALALVRFGVRDANDPRILDTVKAIDAVLAVDLPIGRVWRRYSGDEYGEYADGAPFDGHGIGRPWPLLVGERAHYELARGDRDAALALVRVIEACANECGMIPEQIWDRADLSACGLMNGGATHSASPLGWVHAEYVKLCRSLADGRVFDAP